MELSPLNSTSPAVFVAPSAARATSASTAVSGSTSGSTSTSASAPTATPVSGQSPSSGTPATPPADINQEAARLEGMAKEIQRLAKRDREVRAHEQAHAAAGGQYAGAPALEYTRGPNGVSYATSGHVSIDTSAVPGDPEATLQKAIIVQRAALAPAEPSSQDRQVAAKAAQMAARARAEIARGQAETAGNQVPGSLSPDHSEPAEASEASESSEDSTQSAAFSRSSAGLGFDRPEVSQ